MEKKSFSNFLKFLGYGDLLLDDFWTLGNSTSLSEENADKQFEFHRGPLIYALICYLKPKRILEFGTGGGYSTLCMAKALTDSKIDGKIYTVDRVGNTEKISRYYQLPSDKHPQKNNISNSEIWKSVASPEWIDKIIPLQGYSGVVMDKNDLENIDFCYIDGNHSYDGTKHDFLSFLKIASDNFSVLFDDYIERDFYGVKEFIDKEVEPNFNSTLINTDPNKDFQQFIKNEHDYGMVYFKHESLSSPLKNYDQTDLDLFLKQYRNNDYNIRSRRYNIEKKIPFLKNIRFKFWKK